MLICGCAWVGGGWIVCRAHNRNPVGHALISLWYRFPRFYDMRLTEKGGVLIVFQNGGGVPTVPSVSFCPGKPGWFVRPMCTKGSWVWGWLNNGPPPQTEHGAWPGAFDRANRDKSCMFCATAVVGKATHSRHHSLLVSFFCYFFMWRHHIYFILRSGYFPAHSRAP